MAAFVFAVPFFVLAQETEGPVFGDTVQSKAVLLATVNIYNATFIQTGNNFSLSFDLTNKVGVQPGIKYSAVLIKETKEGQVVVDEHVYDEVVALGENSSVHKIVDYTAPANLEGEYTLLISSKNTSDFPFGQILLGTVNLQKSATDANPIAIDTQSCYLTVEGEEGQPHHVPSQGVVISSAENLQSNCLVENTSSSPVVTTPLFTTRARSNFGGTVDAQGGDIGSITLAPYEKRMVVTALPKPLLSQSYSVNLQYGSTSNRISYYYVISGGGATIQSILFDKDNYTKGETADISFMWSPSVDTLRSFSQGTTPKPTTFSVTILLVDENGNSCANPFNQSVTSQEMRLELTIPMTASCLHPKADVTLMDAQSNTSSHVSFETGVASPSLQKGPNVKIVALSVFVILLFIIGAFVFYRKRIRISLPPTLLFFIVVMGSMFLGPGSAKADTFAMGYGVYTVSINKASYAPGEPMTIYGSVRNLVPSLTFEFRLFYAIDTSIYNSCPSCRNVFDVGVGGSPYSTSVSAFAPSGVGGHSVTFLAADAVFAGVHTLAGGFTVTSACAPDQGTACPSTTANVCGQTQSDGAIQCDGSCSSTTPPITTPNGTTYRASCVSSTNACDQTQSDGTIQCDGSCSSTPPPNSNCPLPTLDFSANPTTVTSGDSSTITWTTTNATWCWAWSDNTMNDGNWTIFDDGTPGDNWKISTDGTHTQTVFPTASTTYSMECGNSIDASSGAKQATVTVPARINGGWSLWSNCSSTTCGTDGTQTRTCTNPAPSGGGADCVGPLTQSCTNLPCCIPDCSAAVNYCSGTSFDDSCGGSCTGTRFCNFNWKEVAP
ncbi:MAG: hypothetical protein Q7S04_00125 [Candidatus Moranbacteria bacterium]|nr:hypothetical protein [Candidatus Moranbacteria bacterium]